MISSFRFLLCSLILLASSQWLRADVTAVGGYSGTNTNHGYINLNSNITVTVTLSGGDEGKSGDRYEIWIDFDDSEDNQATGNARPLIRSIRTEGGADGDLIGTSTISTSHLNGDDECTGGCESYFDLWVTYDEGDNFIEVDWEYPDEPDQTDIKYDPSPPVFDNVTPADDSDFPLDRLGNIQYTIDEELHSI